MKRTRITLIALFSFLTFLQSCSTSTQTMWVAGYKQNCSKGAGKGTCLVTSKSDKINGSESWQTFYSPIQGFNYQEGMMQKVKMKVTKLKKSQVPADGSTMQYSLESVIESMQDDRKFLNGSWILQTLDGNPINRMEVLPTLNIDLPNMTVSGNNGCNQFTTKFDKLSTRYFQVGRVAATQKACVHMDLASKYDAAINTVVKFKVTSDNLFLYDANDKNVLSFLRQGDFFSGLDKSWTCVRINGNPINRKDPIPTMTVNSKDGMVSGSDGCNNYNARITQINANALVIAPAAITKKSCINMTTSDAFDKVISTVKSYKLENNMLVCFNEAGDEVLAFIPAP